MKTSYNPPEKFKVVVRFWRKPGLQITSKEKKFNARGAIRMQELLQDQALNHQPIL